MEDFESLSLAASESVRAVSWEDAGDAVDALLRNALLAEISAKGDHAQIQVGTGRNTQDESALPVLSSV
jgi:hypothetical protein